MNIFEHMNRKTAYTAQELADLIGSTLKETEIELIEQYQKGRVGIETARGYKFYFINESTKV